MTPVMFEGAAPYALPALQIGEATERGENVEMALWVLVKGIRTAVYVEMAQRTADDLGTKLLQAAAKAYANKRGA